MFFKKKARILYEYEPIYINLKTTTFEHIALRY
jgi:hypothetical protein